MRFRSLSAKIVVSLVLMAALPLVLVITLSHEHSLRAARQTAGQALASLADSTLDILYRNLSERYGDTQAFALNPQAASLDPVRLEETLNAYTDLYDLYDLMLVTDVGGRIVVANTKDHEGRPLGERGRALVGGSLADQPWFAAVAGHDPAKPVTTSYDDLASDPRVAAVTGGDGLSLRFSAPIIANGKVVGVWTNYASWERVVRAVFNDLAHVKLAALGMPDAEITLLDRAGGILYDGSYHQPEVRQALGLVSDYNPGKNLAADGLQAARLLRERTTDGSGYTVEPHLRTGRLQVNAWAWRAQSLGFPGYGWGLLVRQPVTHSEASAWSALRFELLIALVALALAAFAALRIGRGIVRPLQSIEAVMDAVSHGDLTRRADVASHDEIGRLGLSVNRTIDDLRDLMGTVARGANSLSDAATELAAISAQLVSTATETNAQAAEVSGAGVQVSASVGTVAASAEEMALAVQEISTHAHDSSNVATEAEQQAKRSDELVAHLGRTSTEIGTVAQTIATIADQTNLLALNATIEAARAGESGRGFAVVAGEVKELARQTASATEDVRGRIEAIQADTQATVNALATIRQIIGRIRETQQVVAAAVEEQATTTRDMTRNLAEASRGTGEIAKQIASVAEAAQVVNEGATRTQQAAADLAKLAEEMRAVVSRMRL
jgi:methyl-accepting chemotaxis protein